MGEAERRCAPGEPEEGKQMRQRGEAVNSEPAEGDGTKWHFREADLNKGTSACGNRADGRCNDNVGPQHGKEVPPQALDTWVGDSQQRQANHARNEERQATKSVVQARQSVDMDECECPHQLCDDRDADDQP